MKKILLLLSLCLYLDAGCFWPEFKVSYYRFNASCLREAVGNGAVYYQGELNYQPYQNISLFFDAGYFKAETDRSILQVAPLTIGGKINASFFGCAGYLGGGFRTMPFSLTIHNREHKHTELGGMVTAGLNFCFKGLLFNPFVEYSFNKRKFPRQESYLREDFGRQLNLSGYSLGAGFGYMF